MKRAAAGPESRHEGTPGQGRVRRTPPGRRLPEEVDGPGHVPEGRQGAASWQPAPGNEWSTPVRARRARAVAFSRWLAPLAGQRLVFSRLLARALRQAEGERGFRLSPFYALAYYGERLLIEIDPASMTRVMRGWLADGPRQVHTLDAFLSAASWQRLALPLGSTEVTRQMQELFAAGMDHTRTQTYRNMLRALRQGKPASRRRQILDSEAAIESYFADVRGLVESIRTNGVVSHRTGAGTFVVDRDIGVALDADGDIVKLPGGQHRVAIASALGIPRIPVEVRMIHTGLLRGLMDRKGLDAVEAVLAACADASAPLRD